MTATARRRPPRGPTMDERIRARRRSVRQEAARRRRRWAATLLALVVMAVGALAIARSPLFAISDVRVVGLDDAGEVDLVRTAAGIVVGENLVSVDLAGATERVEALAWVSDATLRRMPPSTVAIEVTRRQPVAVVLVGGGAWLVDADGVVIQGGTRDGLPILEAPNSVLPGAGAEVSDAAIRSALAVHTTLPKGLRDRVTRYEAPSGRGLRLLVDGVWVRFGEDERVPEKAQVIEGLLAQVRDQAAYAEQSGQAPPQVAEIDVRAPDNPVLIPGPPGPQSAGPGG